MTNRNILVIGLGGPPCAGKTTLMREFMKRLSPSTRFVRMSARDHQPVKGHIDPYARVFVMGDYREEAVGLFGGTDKLSMGVQPHALALLRQAAAGESLAVDDGPRSPPWQAEVRAFVFEGDRLFNGKFIASVRDLPATASRFIVLHTSAEAKAERRQTRGDAQSAEWLAGRESKYVNLVNMGPRVEMEQHETPEDTHRLADWLFHEVGR